MGETRKMAAEKLDHLLSTAGLDEEARAHVIVANKIRTIRALMLLEKPELDALVSEKFVLGDAVLLKSVQNWVRIIESKGDDLSLSLDVFKEKYNEEYYESSLKAVAAPLQDIKVKSTSSPSGEHSKSDISVKLTDYPEFDGKNSTWYTFRQEFEATAAIHQKQALLNVENLVDHLEKRKNDPIYDGHVRDLYYILMRKTAKGTALTTVLRQKDTQDGALAWKGLRDYYDQEGDKQIYAAKCLSDLINLKLHYNSHGGMDKYISDFEVRCRQLDEAGQPLTETQKKTMLLQGITDRDYDATKQICAKDDYETVILTLRHRAAELGKAQNSNNRRRVNKASSNDSARKANKVTKGMKNKFNQKNDESEPKKKNENEPGAYLSQATWESMSPENRKLWIKMRKEHQGKEKGNYGKQYDTRKANVASSTEATENGKENANDNKPSETGHKTEYGRGDLWRRACLAKSERTPTVSLVYRQMPGVTEKRKLDDWETRLIKANKNPRTKVSFTMPQVIHGTPGIHVKYPTGGVEILPVDEAKENWPKDLAEYAMENGLAGKPGWEWVFDKYHVPRKVNMLTSDDTPFIRGMAASDMFFANNNIRVERIVKNELGHYSVIVLLNSEWTEYPLDTGAQVYTPSKVSRDFGVGALKSSC